MAEIKDIKCKCYGCHDDAVGCTSSDCETDNAISMQKVKETAKANGVSVSDVATLLREEALCESTSQT